MKGLSTLIKLHKRALDELRRKLGLLENQKSQLQLLLAKLRQELEEEMRLASRQPEMAQFFGDFAKRMRRRQEEVQSDIHGVDRQIAAMQDEIAAAFAELKKFEIAQENAKRRAEAEEKRKETILLDEVAGMAHRRKQMTEEE